MALPPSAGEDFAQAIDVDRFGNATTRIRAGSVARDATIEAGGTALAFARTFGERESGE